MLNSTKTGMVALFKYQLLFILLVGGVLGSGLGCGAHSVTEGDGRLGEGADSEPIPPAQITPIVRNHPPDPEPEEPPTLEEQLRGEAITCLAPLPVYHEGRRIGRICPENASKRGLTVVDLSNSWAPHIFSEDMGLGVAGRQPYLKTYLALADERFEDLGRSRRREQYLELYGIFPTFRVLGERLNDNENHSCHEGVGDDALASLGTSLRPSARQGRTLRRRIRHVRHIRARLEQAAERLGLASIEELETNPQMAPLLERYQRDRNLVESVAAMQAHLRCDEYLGSRYARGVFDGPTLIALRRFQRRHMIVSRGELDDDTRQILAADSRENDYKAILRALRERVIDATGLIEDGSAAREWGTVLGHQLNSAAFLDEGGQPPASNPAADLISPATEAAARALGWTDPTVTAAFLAALGPSGTESFRVALRLPPLPEYHSEHMDIRAEHDRGDVYYELGNRGREVERRPTVTLFVRHGVQEIALMRWGTTIGGWQRENTDDGGVGLRYKNSPVGRRIWRDVVASPAWLPPESTPNEELLTRAGEGYAVQRALMGPGYRSAFGLVLMMHHEVLPSRGADGELRVRDEGIRTHGSVSYRSILGGFSHGCHRVFNHLAVRLAAFLVRHRRHERRGSLSVDFGREFEWEGEEYSFHIDSRGYLYELTPPVEIEVLEGNILGPRETPSRGFRNVRYPEEEPFAETAPDETTTEAAPLPATTE